MYEILREHPELIQLLQDFLPGDVQVTVSRLASTKKSSSKRPKVTQPRTQISNPAPHEDEGGSHRGMGSGHGTVVPREGADSAAVNVVEAMPHRMDATPDTGPLLANTPQAGPHQWGVVQGKRVPKKKFSTEEEGVEERPSRRRR